MPPPPPETGGGGVTPPLRVTVVLPTNGRFAVVRPDTRTGKDVRPVRSPKVEVGTLNEASGTPSPFASATLEKLVSVPTGIPLMKTEVWLMSVNGAKAGMVAVAGLLKTKMVV